jgi:acid phosphatase
MIASKFRGRPPSAIAAFAGALALLAILPVDIATAAECPSKPYRQVLEPTQPLNVGELKRQVLDYKCFGAYDRDVANVLHRARRYLEARAPYLRKPALVLDIDETSLSNWRQLLANDFGYIIEGDCDLRPNFACGTLAWEESAQADVIKPTLDLFNAAKRKGVAVFFISGRIEDERERLATEANLRRAGYDGWTGLVLKPRGLSVPTIADFKAPERARIEKLGYRIIANVGDQWSDLRGGHAERIFRVPNPFYFIR